MERKGRTNAEKQLRLARMQLAAAQAAAAAAGGANGSELAPPGCTAGGGAAAEGAAVAAGEEEDRLGVAASSVAGIKGAAPPITMFPVRPIGYLHSCFSTR
jgi:hypothetical protein